MPAPTDSFGTTVPSWGPAYKAVAITPADATDLTAQGFRGLWVGTGGTLIVVMFGDASNTPVTFTNVPDGSLLPLAVKVVRTATTASGIVGLS